MSQEGVSRTPDPVDSNVPGPGPGKSPTASPSPVSLGSSTSRLLTSLRLLEAAWEKVVEIQSIKLVKMQPTLAPAPHSMRASGPDNNAADHVLREHLLAQVHNSPHPHKIESLQTSSSASPHDHNIDPAIAGTGMMSTSAGESGGDDNGSDGKKGGKRELSTSKRAAQNRAAQRAFRQRKEGHIKQLEAQVKDYTSLSESYKIIQAENYQLRDYIISLQSRLIESQGEFPQPPSNIEIQHPRSSAPQTQHAPAPTAQMGTSAVGQLQASAAQAVADLNGNKHHHEEAAYLAGTPTSKRARMHEGAELRSALASQLDASNADTKNRSLVA